MEFEKLPICYRLMESKDIKDKLESEDEEAENYYVESSHHVTKQYQPTIFYKAISKIIAFGNNKK